MLDLMWGELNFTKILEYNKNKYVYIYAKMEETLFDTLIKEITPINQELEELLEHSYNHKDLTIVRLKSFIDDKTKLIMNEAREDAEHPVPHRMKYNIEMVTSVTGGDSINLHQLPDQTTINTSG